MGLIDKDELREAIDGTEWYHLHDGKMVQGANSALHIPYFRAEDVYKVIYSAPTIELPERKKGKWLVDEDGNMECPFCGNTCGFGNYCNECGADLRGERNEID